MGITHFVGLGQSPGAVTAGLSYLKHEFGDSTEYGKIVEKVVIFTSPEIVRGEETAFLSVENDYMRRNTKREWKNKSSLEIVKDFLSIEFENLELYLCEVNVKDFSKCFEAITKALLKFHSPGKVGRHIWANLTGGTNILNSALMHVVYLSGFIPVLYYTFVARRDDEKFLRPFSRNENEFSFKKIYAFKTTFDERYEYLLEELESIQDEWITSSDLLSRLKRNYPNYFQHIELKSFQRDYLNVMIAIERKGSRIEGQEDQIRLNKDGKEMLKIIRSPLFKALIRQEDFSLDDINKLTQDIEIKNISGK